MKRPTSRRDVERRPTLSDTEIHTLKLIAGGATNAAISADLGVPSSTNGRKLTALFTKLGAVDRTNAALIALAVGVINVDDFHVPTWVTMEMRATTGKPSHVGQEAVNA